MIAYPLVTSMVSPLIRGLASGSVESGDGGGSVGDKPTLDWNPASGKFASEVGPTPTFTRASGATMVDVNGNVVWGPENLLFPSEDMADTTRWQGIAAVAGQPDPIGGTTAFLLTPTTTGQFFTWFARQEGVTYIFEIWLKSSTGINFSVTISLEGGGAIFTPVVANVTPVWQKFRCTAVAGSGDIFPLISSLDAGDNLLMWHPQACRSTSPYIPTTSAPVYGPRITYHPTTHECLGYLSEEQRTNIITNSQDPGGWLTQPNAILNANAAIAPDGLMTAMYLDETAGFLQHATETPNSGVFSGAGLPDTESIFLKYKGRQWVMIRLTNSAGTPVYAWFDLLNGVLGTVQSPLIAKVQAFPNGWYRLSASCVTPDGWSGLRLLVELVDSDGGNSNYNGVPGTGVYIWGAQFEQNCSFPTSYIPTTTAAVTRSADVCQIGGTDFTSFYNQSEGTFVVDAVFGPLESNHWIMTATNSSYSDSIEFVRASINQLFFQVYVTGSGWQFDLRTPGFPINSDHNIAAAYKINDFALSYDGNPTAISTVGMVPSGCDRLLIGQRSGASSHNSTIASITYFNTRLPDAKLIELTS